MRKKLTIVSVIGLTLIVAISFSSRITLYEVYSMIDRLLNSDQRSLTRVSALLPSFSLKSLQGGVISDHHFRTGAYVFIFVVSDCKACDNIIQWLLNIVHQTKLGKHFVVVVKEDSQKIREMLQPLVEQEILVLIDPEGVLAYPLLVELAPTVALFNDSILFRVYTNPGNLINLYEDIDRLIQGKLQPDSPLSLTAGEPFPDLVFQDLEGRAIYSSNLSKPSLLAFGDDDCIATQMLVPQLEALLNIGISIYLILLNRDSSLQTSVPVLLDPTLRVADQLGLSALPTLVWINSEGVITWIQIGTHSELLKVGQIINSSY